MTSTRPSTGSSVWPIVAAAAIFAGVLTALTAWIQHRPAAPAAPADPAPTFTLTSQSGATVSSGDLRGKVWIACFVFTRCAGPCPRMTETMASLTRRITDDRVRFVSFSVDPTYDTPQVLAKYATGYDADPSRWLLLTEPGTSYLDIAAGFKVMAKPADGSHPILHSEKFFLVDKSGNVRGMYSWSDEAQMGRLVADATALAAE